MLLPLPRRFRPFALDLVLTLWSVLELTYLAGLGDVSWLPAHPDVHLRPQARAAALVSLFDRSEIADAGLSRWVFPVWRFTSPRDPTQDPDALDLAVALRGAACLRPTEVTARRGSRLGPFFEEHARAVWLARHWSVDEMLQVWVDCSARSVATGPADALQTLPAGCSGRECLPGD